MIFVSIAAYRDPELIRTIDSMITLCSNPKSLTICIIDQNDEFFNFEAYEPLVHKIIHVKIPWEKAKGAGWARKQAMQYFGAEDYFLQIDSHTLFEECWLERLMAQYDAIDCDKKIISIVPPRYSVRNNKVLLEKDSQPVWSSVQHGPKLYLTGVKNPWDTKSCYRESHTISAAFLFADKRFVAEIPYDDLIPFWTEEITTAMRAYTRGWHIYAIKDVPLRHFYVRTGYPKIWDSSEKTKERPSWQFMNRNGLTRGKDVLLGVVKDEYGIGDRKLYKKYQEMLGFTFREHYARGGK